MEMSPRSVEGPTRIDALFGGEQAPLEPEVQTRSQSKSGGLGDAWIEMLGLILNSVANKRRQHLPKSLKHRIRQLSKLASHKAGAAVDQPQIDRLSRQMGHPVRMPTLAHDHAVRLLRQNQKGQETGAEWSKEEGRLVEQELLARCGQMRQRVLKPELKERVETFFHKSEQNPRSEEFDKQVGLLRPESHKGDEKEGIKHPEKDSAMRTEKRGEKERFEAERASERDKATEKDKNTRSAKEVEPSGTLKETAAIPLPKQLDKIHPDFFLGLGSLQGAAERVAKQAAFRQARAVILVQGSSERIFLNYLLKLYGRVHGQVFIWSLAPDEAFSDAWCFLRRLRMPYVTLLDLELGRVGGGWSKLRLVLRKLLAMQDPRKKRLDLDEEGIQRLPDGHMTTEGMDPYLSLLEFQGVFFSGPLDFHFMMLRTFPRVYQRVGQVQIGADMDAWKLHLDAWVSGEEGYQESDRTLFAWYQGLMCEQDPEPLHRAALRMLGGMDLFHELPEVLLRLLHRARALTRARS